MQKALIHSLCVVVVLQRRPDGQSDYVPRDTEHNGHGQRLEEEALAADPFLGRRQPNKTRGFVIAAAAAETPSFF